METRRQRTAIGGRVAAVCAVALAAAAPATSAQSSDCASSQAALLGRPTPVCTPPAALSPAETVLCAEHARLVAIVGDCRRAAARDDRRFLERYPDEAAHRKAEAAELATVLVKLRAPNARLAELLRERKTLAEKAEFHRGKALPPDLQRDTDANEASLHALRDVFRGLEFETSAIVDKYGDERSHLRKLWGGAAPGSVGVFVPRTVPAAVARGGTASKT